MVMFNRKLNADLTVSRRECACMHVYMCWHVNVCVCACTRVLSYVHESVVVSVFVYVCMCVLKCWQVNMCVHSCVSVCACACVCVVKYVHACVCVGLSMPMHKQLLYISLNRWPLFG